MVHRILIFLFLPALAATLCFSAAPEALAQQSQTQGGFNPFSGRGSNRAPIEITSDNLEVQQDRQMAIFTGSVEVVQGDMRLRAERLRVYYRENGQAQGRTSRTPSNTRGSVPDQSITRIEAEGRVFVSSPEETAQGDFGIYDLERNQILLTGTVILTQGQSVLRGNRATMSMDTGRSVMEGGEGGGRVRGLFMPSGAGNRPPQTP